MDSTDVRLDHEDQESPSKQMEGITKHQTQQGTANRRLIGPFMPELSKGKKEKEKKALMVLWLPLGIFMG